MIAAGMESGSLDFWSADALLQEGAESAKALIHRADKHRGAVRGIDFNPFQENLLASGFLSLSPFSPSSLLFHSILSTIPFFFFKWGTCAGGVDGEVFIWDLNNPTKVS